MLEMQYVINQKILLTKFAANYDCNAYGSGTYNNTDCATSTGTSSDSPLAGTGFDVIMVIALALALILAGLALLAKKMLRKMKNENQEAATVVSREPSHDEEDDR